MKAILIGIVITTLLFVQVNSVNASAPVYDIISFTPTNIHLTESIKLYAQVSFVQSGVGVQNVNFRWYINSTELYSENSTSSTLNYTPETTGTYLINATVNGYSNGQVITVTVLPLSNLSLTSSPIVTEFPIIAIIPILGAILTGAIIVRIKKQGKLQV
jgi:hypothetical protein